MVPGPGTYDTDSDSLVRRALDVAGEPGRQRVLGDGAPRWPGCRGHERVGVKLLTKEENYK